MKAGVDYVGLGCGAMIVDETGTRTLLLRRSKKESCGVGEWNRPGGKVDFGETVENAVFRETLEETGVKIKIIKFLGYTDHLIENRHFISAGFLAKIIEGEPQNMEPESHDRIEWFALDKLPKDIAQPTKEGIETYLKGRDGCRN